MSIESGGSLVISLANAMNQQQDPTKKQIAGIVLKSDDKTPKP